MMFPNKWAFLVGASEYRRLPPLRYSSQDAIDLRTSFVEHLEFPESQVLLLSDAAGDKPERDEIFDSLGKLRDNDQIGEDDLLVFYFSGHGYHDPDSAMDYLLPTGATMRNIQRTSISMADVVNELKATPCKNVIAFIDACREGLDDSKGLQKMGTVSQQTVNRPGMATFFSCDPRGLSYEIPDLGHGSFTYCLLEAIKDEDVNTVEELSDYLRAQVPIVNSEYNKRPQQPYLVPNPQDILALPIFSGRLVKRAASDEYENLTGLLTELFNGGEIESVYYADALALLDQKQRSKWDTAKMKLLHDLCASQLPPKLFMKAWQALNRVTLSRTHLQRLDVIGSGRQRPDGGEDEN